MPHVHLELRASRHIHVEIDLVALCRMLELPDVCYIEKSIASRAFPDHVATMVEELFYELEDGTKLKGWDSIMLVR